MTKIIVPFRNFANAPKLKAFDPQEELSVDGSLIQKFAFKTKDWVTRTGFISLGSMTTGGTLVKSNLTLGFRKTRGIP